MLRIMNPDEQLVVRATHCDRCAAFDQPSRPEFLTDPAQASGPFRMTRARQVVLEAWIQHQADCAHGPSGWRHPDTAITRAQVTRNWLSAG
jgi:hypothetical protein